MARVPGFSLYRLLRFQRTPFFRPRRIGRMAYVGSVKDDTEKILGREPLLLRDWAKLHADELLEIAGR